MVASVRCIAVVDDGKIQRDTYVEEINEARGRWSAVGFPGRFLDTFDLYEKIRLTTGAALCDMHLVRNYASFDGAEAAAALNRRNFPAVLVTRLEEAALSAVRPHRKHIPVMLDHEEHNPDAFAHAIEICERECRGDVLPERRPWATMVHVEDFGDEAEAAPLIVHVPTWKRDTMIELPRSMFPERLLARIRERPYFWADVNKGAAEPIELFFDQIRESR